MSSQLPLTPCGRCALTSGHAGAFEEVTTVLVNPIGRYFCFAIGVPLFPGIIDAFDGQSILNRTNAVGDKRHSSSFPALCPRVDVAAKDDVTIRNTYLDPIHHWRRFPVSVQAVCYMLL